MSGNGGKTFITEDGSVMFDDELLGLLSNSKQEMELLLASVVPTSQSTLLLKKEAQARDVDRDLELARASFKRRMDILELRMRDFKSRQQDMREYVAKFEKYILENDIKRQRADTKYRQEVEASRRRQQEIDELEVQLQQLLEKKQELQGQWERLRCYQEYLESVLGVEEDFQNDIELILNRFRTLSEGNKELSRHVDFCQHESDRLRHLTIDVNKASQDRILMDNSQLQRVLKEIESVQRDNGMSELVVEQRLGLTKNKTSELGRVQMSILNIFTRVVAVTRNRRSFKSGMSLDKDKSPEALSRCLEFIGERLLELQDICGRYSKEKVASSSSSSATTSQYLPPNSPSGGGGSGGAGGHNSSVQVSSNSSQHNTANSNSHHQSSTTTLSNGSVHSPTRASSISSTSASPTGKRSPSPDGSRRSSVLSELDESKLSTHSTQSTQD
eukprot:GILI01016586.1.p1 GENE.GILI01016586.1~~GILI01016586.1.p1  ORF type:complete len:445 (-),score=91.77 GILI01016586.1:37-1371(-)